jgi:hypothetical protein
MSFLKKLGTIVLKVIGIWTGIAPIVEGALPQGGTATTIEDKLGKLFNLIVTVEQTSQRHSERMRKPAATNCERHSRSWRS